LARPDRIKLLCAVLVTALTLVLLPPSISVFRKRWPPKMWSSTDLVIFYSYGIPLFLVNTRTVYILWSKRVEFESTFYTLFFICGCNDLVLYLANNYAVRLTSYEPLYNLYYSNFSEFSYWPAIPMFVVLFCSLFTHCGSLLISLNRLTAICLRTQYDAVRFVIIHEF
jgi:hypothetical protein